MSLYFYNDRQGSGYHQLSQRGKNENKEKATDWELEEERVSINIDKPYEGDEKGGELSIP